VQKQAARNTKIYQHKCFESRKKSKVSYDLLLLVSSVDTTQSKEDEPFCEGVGHYMMMISIIMSE
jgi:hypothetical protein